MQILLPCWKFLNNLVFLAFRNWLAISSPILFHHLHFKSQLKAKVDNKCVVKPLVQPVLKNLLTGEWTDPMLCYHVSINNIRFNVTNLSIWPVIQSRRWRTSILKGKTQCRCWTTKKNYKYIQTYCVHLSIVWMIHYCTEWGFNIWFQVLSDIII